MSCCGEPKDTNADHSNRPISQYQPQPLVTQQPSPVPYPIAQNPFQATSISSPPPVHYGQNGYGSGLPWTSTPSPPPTNTMSMGASRPTSGHGLNGSIGHSFNESMSMRRSSFGMTGSHYPSPMSPPPISTSSSARIDVAPLPPDEGKMSVSIDFGAYSLLFTIPSLLIRLCFLGTTFSGVVRSSAQLVYGLMTSA